MLHTDMAALSVREATGLPYASTVSSLSPSAPTPTQLPPATASATAAACSSSDSPHKLALAAADTATAPNFDESVSDHDGFVPSSDGTSARCGPTG